MKLNVIRKYIFFHEGLIAPQTPHFGNWGLRENPSSLGRCRRERPALISIFYTLLIYLTTATILSATELEITLDNVTTQEQPNGKKQPAVGLNQQFTVFVKIKDTDRTVGNISVHGLEPFQILSQGQSQSVQIINGKQSTSISYEITALARQEGTFTIGPATAKQDGSTLSSNTVSLTVSRTVNPPTPQQTSGQQAADSTAASSMLCKLAVDKNNIVVDQPVILSIQIYKKGNIEQFGYEKFDLQNCLIKEIKNPTHRTETTDDTQYQVEEKKFVLIPQKEGPLQIGPIRAAYTTPVQRTRKRRGFFDEDFFSSFFGPQVEQREVQSNALTISVNPLPKAPGHVDGVGTFTSFTATVDKQEATVNEPLMLSLTVEGKGNLDHIATPKLALPEGFKYYDSKSSINEDLTSTYQGGTKKFEYVVQATRPGTMIIPAQVFTFYDVSQKKYISLKSEAISLDINTAEGQAPTAQTQQQPIAKKDTTTEQITEKQPSAPASQQDIHFIQDQAQINASEPFELPWWLIVLLFFIPLIFAYARQWHWLKNIFCSTLHKPSKRKVAIKFEKELANIIKQTNACALHQFFLQFLAAQHHVGYDQVTETWIEQQLYASGWEKEKVDSFLEYLSSCAQLHFATAKNQTNKDNSVLKKAMYWFLMLNS